MPEHIRWCQQRESASTVDRAPPMKPKYIFSLFSPKWADRVGSVSAGSRRVLVIFVVISDSCHRALKTAFRDGRGRY